MGTRADFYNGKGKDAEWLGSIAWDGNPGGIEGDVLRAKTADEFKAALEKFAESRDDWTAVDNGWPWPWEDSHTTDYAYAFHGGKVWASCFGHAWFDPLETEPEHDDSKPTEFPDMSNKKKTAPAGSKRSGIMVFRG
jgi:hypothetical protein